MSYQESQQRLLEAEAASRSGEHERSRVLLREAAELQKAFADEQPADRVRTKSVYGASAATLFYRAGDLDEAERLARDLLSQAWLEPRSAKQLQELLGRIDADRDPMESSVVERRLKDVSGQRRQRPMRRPLFHVGEAQDDARRGCSG